MKREILVCDRCGCEAETKEEKELQALGKICLGFDVFYSSYSHPQVFAADKTWNREWCRKCRAELHILEDEIRKPTAETPAPPSLEDMIREIVRQETT
jgi:hypothetical protein